VAAVRELLEERPFAELSVSTISDQAGVARSGFYFYFDSKYAVLAHILGEVTHELEELTHDFRAWRRRDASRVRQADGGQRRRVRP
jgi:AcrR family transcriptional regulator